MIHLFGTSDHRYRLQITELHIQVLYVEDKDQVEDDDDDDDDDDGVGDIDGGQSVDIVLCCWCRGDDQQVIEPMLKSSIVARGRAPNIKWRKLANSQIAQVTQI